MERDDRDSGVGTIARSGTRECRKARSEAENGSAGDLIGQVGVGCYASFIAADKVTVETRKAGSSESWKWESTGDGTYTIDGGAREMNGTTITLHMKPAGKDDDGEELKDYLSAWTIRIIFKEYSAFVTYPI